MMGYKREETIMGRLKTGLVLCVGFLSACATTGGSNDASTGGANDAASGGSGGVGGGTGSQIIADHTVVSRYADIPEAYLAEIKKMWVNIPGESHSSGYRKGLQLLANSDAAFSASVTESGHPEAFREDALRISRLVRGEQYGNWIESTGEEDWFTNPNAIAGIKHHLEYANTNGLEIAAIGFAWCWDMAWHNPPGGEIDPVFKVRWAGASVGGPDGDLRWGLDADDQALTGNSVSMDDYLDATRQYVDFVEANGYATRVLFTTGPVDGYPGESGYQRQIKQDYIRQYVLADGTRILFDYADILAWNDAGEENTQEWVDGDGVAHSYQMIHSDNMLDLNGSYAEDGDHIGERGAVRLAKAIWWTLARIAGWDDPGN